jgi:hypothetical protein
VIAHAAIEKVGHEALPGQKVRLHLTVYLASDEAERLTANAIRQGKNLDALVSEILEAHLRASQTHDREP